jgi:hypothetical protein
MSEALEETTVQEEKFDAKAIEQEMLEMAQNRAEDPAETAAMVYHMYRPEFIKRVTKLSSRAKSRLIAMLVQYPLNGEGIKFPNDDEKACYFLADSMIQAKFVLMLDSYKEGAQELIKAQEEFIFNKEEVEALTTEGENNGI